ncbi:MAG: GatB/YqeY domain-containing protein [Candidatus Uhrbacteria bacterium]|nr:GatB/YqeY domain-containing protein [Candidatus Uhrbacteria bacterium]
MTILEQIDHDFKEAMKAKDEGALSTLRLMRTALKNKQIEVQHDLTEPETTAVLKTMLKQYQDALQDFMTAGRQDLVIRQQQEIDLISGYLPPALSNAELERIVSEAVNTSGIKETGRAMGVAMKAVGGQADGAEVRKIVEKILSN